MQRIVRRLEKAMYQNYGCVRACRRETIDLDEVATFGRQRPTSITNYQARKVTHCHASVNGGFGPVAAPERL